MAYIFCRVGQTPSDQDSQETGQTDPGFVPDDALSRSNISNPWVNIYTFEGGEMPLFRGTEAISKVWFSPSFVSDMP